MTSIQSTSAGDNNDGMSLLRRQIIASGAMPIAVNPKAADNPHARYVMPSLLIKRGGAHGGSMLLSNLSYLCSVLHRPPTVMLKYFAGELGCRVIHTKDPKADKGGTQDTFTIIGNHEDERLLAAIYKFNERCVLCHRCRGPECTLAKAETFGDEAKDLAKAAAAHIMDLPTNDAAPFLASAPATYAKTLKGLSASKLRLCLTLDCKGCGHVSFLDPLDKLHGFLASYLLQEEEEARKAAKAKEAAALRKAMRRKEKEDAAEVEDEEGQGAEGTEETTPEVPEERPLTEAELEALEKAKEEKRKAAAAAADDFFGSLDTKKEKSKKEKKDKKEKKEKSKDKSKEADAGETADSSELSSSPKEKKSKRDKKEKSDP